MKAKTVSVVSGILLALLLIPSSAKANSQGLFTTTSDFNAGSKPDEMVLRDHFASNGVSQPTNGINYPSAEYYNGKTYIAWQGSPDSNATSPDPFITYYNSNLKIWAPNVRIADGLFPNDDHGAPALVLTSDHHLLVFCCTHTNPFRFFRSVDSESINGWNELPSPLPFDERATYPHPIRIGNTIYLLYRYSFNDNLHAQVRFVKTTDDGNSWTAPVVIMDPGLLQGLNIGFTFQWADQIHMMFLYIDASSVRQNIYEAYLNTTTSMMMCKTVGSDSNLGTMIDLSEANTFCRVESSGNFQTGGGSVRIDTTGKPYMIYPVQLGSTWNTNFSRWTGAAWTTPQTILSAGTDKGSPDFILNSPTSIEAYIVTAGLVSAHRGGDIQKWTWNGATWTFVTTVKAEKITTYPLSNPQIVHAFGPIKLIFPEINPDDYTSKGAARIKEYAWNGTGFVQRLELSGTLRIQTLTDNPSVPADSLQLANGKADFFTVKDLDGFTDLWHIGRYVSGTPGSEVNLISDINNLIPGRWLAEVETGGNGDFDTYGRISSFTFSGNFDFYVYPKKHTAENTTRAYVYIVNEDVASQSSSATVDGMMYEVFWQIGDRRFLPATITNGVATGIGGTQFLAPDDQDRCIRMSRVTNTITWYYGPSTGACNSWTVDQTTSFTFTGNLHLGFMINANRGRLSSYEWSNYVASTMSLQTAGYVSSGNWTSANQTFSGDSIGTFTINYTGVTSGRYIDQVSILSSSNEILYTNPIDIKTGTTITYTVSDIDALFGKDWKFQIRLVGDGTGTPTINDITFNLVRTNFAMAVYDAPWLLGFFALITLGLVGAFAIKRKRGGRN